MKNIIFKTIRKIVFSIGIIYGIDTMLNSIGIYLPINIYTISISTILGIPGIISLFAIFYLT